jgi:hypothetical protein
MKSNYPYWNFITRRRWLSNVHMRWSIFRKYYNHSDITTGCAYYPDEVYEWLNQFEKMDKLMKDFYKNA